MEEDKIGANSYVVVKTSKFALKRFASWLQHSFLAWAPLDEFEEWFGCFTTTK